MLQLRHIDALLSCSEWLEGDIAPAVFSRKKTSLSKATKRKSPERSGLQLDVFRAAALAMHKEPEKYACRQKRPPLTNKRTIG